MIDSPTSDTRMILGDHLAELRQRVVFALVGIGVCSGAALLIGLRIIHVLSRPLISALDAAGYEPNLHFFGPIEAFTAYLKVSIASGLVVASPWVLYQAWRFVSVGMYAAERRIVLLLLPFSALMTALGIAFMYGIMLPICLWFLISFSAQFPRGSEQDKPWILELVAPSPSEDEAPPQDDGEEGSQDSTSGMRLPVLQTDPPSPAEGEVWINEVHGEIRVRLNRETRRISLRAPPSSVMRPMIGIGQYIGFITLLSIGIVVAFQLPVVLLVIGWTGLVPPSVLSRYRPHCIFGCFALGMLLTPSDPISMVLLAVPMWILFEFGLLLMRMVYKPRFGE